MGRKPLPKETRDEIVSMASGDEPLDVKEIAVEVGVSIPTVYRVLQEAGVRPAKKYAEASYKRLSEEEQEEFVARYLDYEPVIDLLDEYSINHTQMYQMLADRDVKPRMRQKSHEDAQNLALDHALELYQNSNLTITEISYETGIHQPMLHSTIHRRGVPLRRPRTKKKDVEESQDTEQAELEPAVEE